MDGKQTNKVVSKRITKSCKSCNKQVPTACKACLCGFRFRKALASKAAPDSSTGSTAPTEAAQSGRIQRTCRERPHFFDSLEYGTHVRRKRVQSSAGDQTGSKLHRWGRPSASARMGKNKLGVRKFKIDNRSNGTSAAESSAASSGQAADFASAKDAANSTGGSSSSCSSRDEDAHSGLSSEKALHYSIILAEINRKYTSVTFRPD